MNAITIACPSCENGTRFAGNHPGGGVWCETCDGTGEVPVHCEACHAPAVRMFQGNPLCMAHFEEWSADALSMAEDA